MTNPKNKTKEVEAAAAAISGVETKKIKSIVLTSTGSGSDYSNLQVKDEEYPKIDKPDQVMVRIKAAGLNFAELMQRQGLYKPSTKTPYTPGYEASGLVEEVSENVTDLKKDDRVIVFGANGIWKEVVVAPRSNIVKIPDDMSFEDAAGLLVNYVTAYQILFRLANIKSGDSVLIHMAAGGVGIAATQLCKTVPGVTVFGTASESKHDAIRAIGVDYPIDYTTSDYVEQIKKISPEGIDVCLDPLNGENSIKGYDLLKPLGRIVHYGAASMTGESRSLANMFKAWWKCLSINSLDIISENKSISGYHLGVLLNNPSFIKTTIADINTLFELYESKKIQITIDTTYGYSKIGEAMKRMHSRQNVGKIILKPDAEMPAPVVEAKEVEAVAAAIEKVTLDTGADKVEETTRQEQTTAAAEQPKIEEKANEIKPIVSEITMQESSLTAGECATRE